MAGNIISSFLSTAAASTIAGCVFLVLGLLDLRQALTELYLRKGVQGVPEHKSESTVSLSVPHMMTPADVLLQISHGLA